MLEKGQVRLFVLVNRTEIIGEVAAVGEQWVSIRRPHVVQVNRNPQGVIQNMIFVSYLDTFAGTVPNIFTGVQTIQLQLNAIQWEVAVGKAFEQDYRMKCCRLVRPDDASGAIPGEFHRMNA